VNPLWLIPVAVAGGVGAGLRYLVDVTATGILSRAGAGTGRFPWGILLVNASGSFALGVISGAVLPAELAVVLGTGLLGGYTTFSAVAVESWLLAEEGRRGASWANLVGTAAACVAAAVLGVAAGAALPA